MRTVRISILHNTFFPCLAAFLFFSGNLFSLSTEKIANAAIVDPNLDDSDKHLLDVKSKKVKRMEIGMGFGGYRPTMIFYTFPEHPAVFKVVIDNRNKMFPVSATLYEFEKNTDEKAIGKWLNNQHSDALFGDAPQPAKTTRLPAQSCETKSSKFIDHAEAPFGKFDKYKVGFQILHMGTAGSFKLKKFSDEASVYLKLAK